RVRHVRRKNMLLAELTFIRGLRTKRVEDRIEYVGVSCLHSLVDGDMSKKVVVAANALIDATVEEILVSEVAGSGIELHSPVATGVRIGRGLNRAGVAGGIVIEIEDVLVNRNLRSETVVDQVLHGQGLIARIGSPDGCTRGQDHP